ncbi:ribonuclease T2 [Ganoderma leucocontextum]|nr:ribonuclease T2 [Ganoderma leucocontextum]
MLATTVALAVALAGSAAAGPSPASVSPLDLFKRLSSGCSTSGPTSCHNTTAVKDQCCFESSGGMLVQKQFWDTNPSSGPSNSWTIHGLWPAKCDGTLVENCDSSRDYTDIAGLLTKQGASDTLSFMKKYWVDTTGKNEQFWEHEWSTHGTCYSTLKPSCLPSGSPTGAEAVAYFQTAEKLFKTLPTYQLFDTNLISPSSSETYSLSTLSDALRYASGVTPVLNCEGSTLNSVDWYFNVKGSLIDGTFVLTNAPPSKGNCPQTGIKYPPKRGSPASTATSHRSSHTAAHSKKHHHLA